MEKYRKEERLLIEDAESVRNSNRMPSAAERSAAIRRGMQRVNSESRRRKSFAYGGAGAVVLAAGALFLTNPGIMPNGEEGEVTSVQEPKSVPQAAAPQDVSLEPFRKLFSGNDMLSGPLNRGDIERTNLIVEQNGYTVKIHGLIRDSRSVTLMYETGAPNGEEVELNESALLNAATGEMLTSSIRQFGSTSYDKASRTTYGYVTMVFEKGTENRSEDVKLRAYAAAGGSGINKERLQNFELPMHLASTEASEEELVFDKPKTLTAGGQEYLIHRVLLTPLAVYLEFEEDAANTDKLFDFIDPRLVMEKDEKRLKMGLRGTSVSLNENAGGEISFVNKEGIVRPDSLSFQVKGINALSKQKLYFVIDTEQEKVLQAPGEGFTVQVRDFAKGVREIKTEYKISHVHNLLLLDETFVDGQGIEHAMTNAAPNATQGGEGSTEEGTHWSYIEDKKYPQPLTFKILAYPAVEMDEQEVQLK
ncbi:hypothetical protein [Saccharibacillus kuerlensis]|uniref:DUF4179 domain-containing protein n=1 Tax=Saccharibacillus kuerlensis TaxID=459527 RepID=A0ABQ2L1V9_9BACL|nr:hypothetical protein [Saccharibacillus kuerlensis]GGN99866.1 hypothetical protein GCM10010969_20420 [Saccharibacillus kuerlensis]